MNRFDSLPKGPDEALMAGYSVVECSPEDEAEMLGVAAQQAVIGPDGRNVVEVLLAPFKEMTEGFEYSELAVKLHALAPSISSLPPLDRAIIENGLRRHLDNLGVKKPAGLISALFKNFKDESEPEEGGNGTKLTIEPTEPYGEPVDGAEVASQVESILRKYLVMPAGSIEAATLWIIHTYLLDALQLTPRLALVSPLKRCGKSTALYLLNALVEKPLLTYQPTPATLFRAMGKYRPTIILDEADTWIRDNETIRSIINGGFQSQGGAMRCGGDEHDLRFFNAYGAIALAGIGQLPSTIEDRSILVGMRRKRKDEVVSKLRLDRIQSETAELRSKIARWAADNRDEIRRLDPSIPSSIGLDDRAEDCWRPLFAIADLLGGPWPAKARDAAIRLRKKPESDEGEIGTLLLSDIRSIFDTLGVDRMFSTQLVDELLALDDRPWSDVGKRGQGLSTHILGRLLAPFGVISTTIRIDQATKKGYYRHSFEEPWERYVPLERPASQSVTTSQPSNDGGSSPNSKRHKKPSVTLSNQSEIPISSRCDGVTLSKGNADATIDDPASTDKKCPQPEPNTATSSRNGVRRVI